MSLFSPAYFASQDFWSNFFGHIQSSAVISSGGVVFGGAAGASIVYLHTPSGALVFGGSAAASITYAHTPSGGVVFGGVAATTFIPDHVIGAGGGAGNTASLGDGLSIPLHTLHMFEPTAYAHEGRGELTLRGNSIVSAHIIEPRVYLYLAPASRLQFGGSARAHFHNQLARVRRLDDLIFLHGLDVEIAEELVDQFV